ncbi:Basic helix-loop-helix DNA-binding superfamily protein, putative isoform 2 [Hibiscus syriacus]|uniref:Basic helix-loop-helix DNA-binding superfamily protein, putative isoform 2 n=1 Tax=Hibiscus syriacus TaxID=106335 RepID=A0A6A3BH94_HIBSY|nr:Basic helix-loop-helix DNA-binding superfamily protein, putative isoform 2 [Hibiscus syriacus]
MESENLHHQHQLQNHLVWPSSSSSISPCHGVSSSHSWIPNITLNSSEFNPTYNEESLHSRPKNDMLASPQNSSMIRDWANSSSSFGESRQLPQANYLENKEQIDLNDLSQKLLFKTISSGFPMFSADSEFYSSSQNCSIPRNSSSPSRGSFSQIYPSINISSLNHVSSPRNIPSSFDMNLEALDFLNPARFRRSSRFCYPSDPSEDHHDSLGIYKEMSHSFGLHHHHNLQQSNRRPAAYSPSQMSPFPAEITKEKRSGISSEAQAAAAAKKYRLESRTSCPPFKVSKEKLRDRIAALQQLVSPFGKTLSVPYMKSSRNKTSRSKQGGSTMEDEDEDEEVQWDLKSRGLCLVPLSCMSYVTSDSGGGIWQLPPHTFTG